MMIEFVFNTASHITSVWRDATNPDEFVDELILAQSDIVIVRESEAGDADSDRTTTESTPVAIDNGSGMFSVPLTASDLNFIGKARLLIHPAGAFPQIFDIEVKSSPDRHIIPQG